MPKWIIAALLIVALLTCGIIQYAYMPINSYEYYNGLSMPIIDMDQVANQTFNKLNGLGGDFYSFLEALGVAPTQYVLTLFTYNTTVNQKAYLLVYMPPEFAEKWTNGTLNVNNDGQYWTNGYRIYAFKEIEGYKIRKNQVDVNAPMVSHMDWLINERVGARKYLMPKIFDSNGIWLLYNNKEANEMTKIYMPTNAGQLADWTSELNYIYRPLQDPDNKNPNAQNITIAYMLESVEVFNGTQDISKFTLVEPY